VTIAESQASYALRLRNGVVIEHPLEALLEFVERDGSYQTYDLALVARDQQLILEDVRVANKIVARMPPRVIANILQRAQPINAALAALPAGASLMQPEAEIPWTALESLFAAMDGIEEVGLPRATKVLHKKRPALIPILDEVVVRYLRAVDGLRRDRDYAADAIALVRSYKNELDANAPIYRAAAQALRDDGFELTECRILDILVWAYSDTYTPQYRRADRTATTPSTEPAAARLREVAQSLSGGAAAGVAVFIDNDAAYLAWLSEHPEGFVLNANRRPTARYLRLHRASCRTISGRPARGGPWTGSYLKVCGDRDALANWAYATTGGATIACRVCRSGLATTHAV
jgi:Family of unknown function (DUF6308)